MASLNHLGNIDDTRNHIRLGFSRISEKELEAAIQDEIKRENRSSFIKLFQSTLKKKVNQSVRTVIHFTDGGQDFLRWYLNDKSVVVKCEPFQGSVWCGCVVLNTHSLKWGSIVAYARDGEQRSIKYPVEKIQTIKRKEASHG